MKMKAKLGELKDAVVARHGFLPPLSLAWQLLASTVSLCHRVTVGDPAGTWQWWRWWAMVLWGILW